MAKKKKFSLRTLKSAQEAAGNPWKYGESKISKLSVAEQNLHLGVSVEKTEIERIKGVLLEEGEIEALAFLKENSGEEDVILTYPFSDAVRRNFPEPPVPMTYYNSPYVSFFTDRRAFLEDQNAANILGYPLEERLAQVKAFFQTEAVDEAREFLVKEGIDYLYLVEWQGVKADPEAIGLEEIFDNQKVKIFQVNDRI